VAAIDWHNHAFIKTFGEDLTYTHGTDPATTVRMIFTREHFEDPTGIGLSLRRTTAKMVAADVPNLDRGDTIGPREGLTYKVVDIMPTHYGMVEVKLEEQ
jgi:hypothetical protein